MARVSFKTVIVEYLTRGVSGVASLRPSRAILWRAMRSLHDHGKSFSDLDNWARETFGVGFYDGRGPVVGGERLYTAQKGSAQRPYGKIPLGTLGISAGDLFAVEFGEEEIVIRRRG